MNAAQHKIVNSLKTSFCSSVFVSVCVSNVCPKTTLLPVWPRDTKSWTPLRHSCHIAGHTALRLVLIDSELYSLMTLSADFTHISTYMESSEECMLVGLWESKSDRDTAFAYEI